MAFRPWGLDSWHSLQLTGELINLMFSPFLLSYTVKDDDNWQRRGNGSSGCTTVAYSNTVLWFPEFLQISDSETISAILRQKVSPASSYCSLLYPSQKTPTTNSWSIKKVVMAQAFHSKAKEIICLYWRDLIWSSVNIIMSWKLNIFLYLTALKSALSICNLWSRFHSQWCKYN